MYRLWVCIFCSVVVHGSLNFLNLGNIFKPKGLLPSYEKIYNRTENLFKHYQIDTLKDKVMNPLNAAAEQVTSIVVPQPEEPVCYKVLGCFDMGSPWKSMLRPIGAPRDPEQIRASVFFFSRENKRSKSVYLYPKINLKGISFKPNRRTVFIVHGFFSSGKAAWVESLKDTYLKVKDVNLFCVNWEEGAKGMDYLRVAGNTRVVGKELAFLFEQLIREHGARAEDFHLIGHSLGAHICSYAAKGVPGIGHLTALDPAQPGFEGFDERVRLDKSDAKFVEVFHTDARPFIPMFGFGMMKSYGHVDFYFNGIFQPGCLIPKTNVEITSLASLAQIPVEILSQLISCSHSRAQDYYIEAIDSNNCTFWGRKINLWNYLELIESAKDGIFKVPNLLKCTPDTCIRLGFSVTESPLKGMFLVLTKQSPPFCRT